MQAYILIKAHIGDIYPALGILRRTKGVISAQAVFGEHDIIALVETAGRRELDQFVSQHIIDIAEIAEASPCILQDM